jgi:hypothetical protein
MPFHGLKMTNIAVDGAPYDVSIIPNQKELLKAMFQVQINYARLHGMLPWQVSVDVAYDREHSLITFTAYRKDATPRGDNT